MTDTPETSGEANVYDPADTISNAWSETWMKLSGVRPPLSFSSKDVLRYGDAVAFLRELGKVLDPFFDTLMGELETTSSVAASAWLPPSEWLGDYIIPEFDAAIELITIEAEDGGEAAEGEARDEALEESDLEGVDEVDVEDDPNGDWDDEGENEEDDPNPESNENTPEPPDET